MTRAYDKLYLEKARVTLARMLDFAVYDLGQDITAFFDLFLSSGVAGLFEQGDVTIIAGKSGIELAYEVLERCGIPAERVTPHFTLDRSREYWAGWALAYYQWETGMTFADIVRCVPVRDILALYDPYHEMDIRQFCDRMNELVHRAQPETNLKRIRLGCGFSQGQLARASGVPVRTIQQYEQRRKDINKAQAEYIDMLSTALRCRPGALLERV